jgi:hypothetical protein
MSAWPVAAGAGAYGAIYLLPWQPMMGLYVLGHELTHACAGFLSGHRIKSFSASPTGGKVVLSGTNTFVALAPYCLPFYTLLTVIIFKLIQLYAPFNLPPFWFPFALGFTFTFHIALTFHALRQKQPDLQYAGVFFSWALILLCNGLVLVLLLKLLFPSWISLLSFGAKWGQVTLFIFGKTGTVIGRIPQLWA